MANELRGSVDGWDFKQYVLGMLFYRYISENLTEYLNEQERTADDGDPGFDYAQLSDDDAEFGRGTTVENNYVDTVIQLPADLFFGTTIGTCVIVLKKSKKDNSVLFVDASAEFERQGNKNKLTPGHRQKILEAVFARADVDHFATLVENSTIGENDYNIAVSSYVEAEDTREEVDIKALNAEIEQIVARQSKLRKEIDVIVADLEGAE